jgi:argininosuccinate lyase
VADALVRRGVAFRVAHHVVGWLVGEAERLDVELHQLDDATFAKALTATGDPTATALAEDPEAPVELRAAADLEGAIAGCDVIGGTAPNRVGEALAVARARLDRGSARA